MKIFARRSLLVLLAAGSASFTGCAIVNPDGSAAILLPPPPPVVVAAPPAVVVGGPAYVYPSPYYRPYYGYGYRPYYGYRGGYYGRGGYYRGGYRGYAWR